jgi:hypothetical protein
VPLFIVASVVTMMAAGGSEARNVSLPHVMMSPLLLSATQ